MQGNRRGDKKLKIIKNSIHRYGVNTLIIIYSIAFDKGTILFKVRELTI